MVAAKLNQSRVLVTHFRQNRLTLKGRSAGQSHRDRHTHTDRHTDSRTNSAEKNGRSDLQSGQQKNSSFLAAPVAGEIRVLPNLAWW